MILLPLGGFAESITYLEESLTLYEHMGDLPMVAMAHNRLGLALLHNGQLEKGHYHAQISVTLGRETHSWIYAQGLFVLSLAEDAAENFAAADKILEDGIAFCHQHQLSGFISIMIATQAYEAWGLGDKQRARRLTVEALRLALEQRAFFPLFMVLPICPLLLLEQGQAIRAAEIYALDNMHRSYPGSYLVEPFRATVYASMCAVLPLETIIEAEERGRQLDLWTTALELQALLEYTS